MTDLIISTRADGKLVVDSRSVASQLGIHHKNFIATIKSYQSEIEQAFGSLAFETETKKREIGATVEKFVLLTEDQAIFLMTLSRNTAQVVQCKILLVQKFSEAKKLIVQKRNIFQEDLMLADYVEKSMLKCGVDTEVAEQVKLESLAKMYPDKVQLLTSAKNTISAKNPLPDAPLTPTEVGIKLGQRLGINSISGRKINKKLLDFGYQVSVTRIKRSNGKETHYYYKATPKGEQHSILLLNAYTDGEGKATKPQLKWYRSIIEILKNNWEG